MRLACSRQACELGTDQQVDLPFANECTVGRLGSRGQSRAGGEQ